MINSQWSDFFAQVAILIPAFMVSVSFHEFSHAFVAYLLGDNTAKNAGRMTLNPLAHIDPFGLLMIILVRVGWARPVPIDQRNFKHPRFYSILTGFAGPVSNFFLASVTLLGIKYFPQQWFAPALTKSFLQVLDATAYINIMLGVFNLLPIPPLDGSHALVALFSKRYPQFVWWLYRYSFFILIFILMIPQTRILLFGLITWANYFLRNLIF